MVDIVIICVGKNKEKFYEEAFQEYKKRLSKSCSIRLTEVAEYRLGDRPSEREIEKALEEEGESILRAIPAGAYLISLCIEGKTLSSPAFSEVLKDCMLGGKSRIAFIIGGSFGLSPKIKELSDLKLSMSAMTFPHHLARVMLAEQLYRAFSILDGSRYHK